VGEGRRQGAHQKNSNGGERVGERRKGGEGENRMGSKKTRGQVLVQNEEKFKGGSRRRELWGVASLGHNK